jgi:Tol biopolymer transport system component
MSLGPGTRLGAFEIVSLLGAGGMGEVYRARDTQLKRDVAIKVLPEPLAADPDRVARFQREAELLATLTHPHIAAIYGFERVDGSPALIMELVDGPTIAERLLGGPVPVDEAICIARELIDGLDYAHEHGVVHRDLKPANLKLTPDGHLKILDFGLAKALDTATATRPGAPGQSMSPTITSPAFTQAGVILGTAAYMSPEQARGQPVDKRSDIWAFGCVVYEMLTGVRAFAGETISDTLAALLTREPDWSRLPAATPPPLRRLMRECLTRDSKLRLRDIGDARRTLETREAETAGSQARPPAHSMVPWAVAGLLALVLFTVVAMRGLSPSPPGPPPLQRHAVELGADASLATDVGSAAALSPDGQLLVFAAYPTGAGTTRLFARRLDQLLATSFPGTDDARAPFFSPDGQWVAFFAEGKLKKVAVTGGAPITLADAPSGRGGAWTRSGSIIFLPQVGGGAHFVRVQDAGGRPEEFMEPDSGASQRWPQVLPGERALLYTQVAPGRAAQIKVQKLPTGERKTIGEGNFARYMPSGHLLFLLNGTLYATRFDPASLTLSGSAMLVAEGVSNQTLNAAQFAASDNGTLVYVSGESLDIRVAINWVNGTGTTSPLRETRSAWLSPVFDPAGRRLAFTEVGTSGNSLWVRDLARGVDSRVADAYDLLAPAWTPDGQRITFAANRDQTNRNIYWQRVDGVGGVQRLTTASAMQATPAWHPDGRTLVYISFSGVRSDLMTLQMLGDEQTGWKAGPSSVLFETPYQEEQPTISPDGKWIAYVANDTGTREVYVRPFPGPGGATLVSSGGGEAPTWSQPRRELIYATLRRGATAPARVMVAPFAIENGEIRFDLVRPWGAGVDLPVTAGRNFALHPAGDRLAVAAAPVVDTTRADRLVFVFNLFDELRRLAK